jgi:hypothetical protein
MKSQRCAASYRDGAWFSMDDLGVSAGGTTHHRHNQPIARSAMPGRRRRNRKSGRGPCLRGKASRWYCHVKRPLREINR